MPAMEEDQDPRRAKIQKEDIETYGPSEKCPGCRAQVAGKYRSKHTDECRSRFEKVLAQDDKGRRRFEAAATRRLNAITKKACELQETIEKQAAAATPDPDPDLSRNIQPSGSASGSGLTVEQRSEELRQLKDSEMRQRLADSKGEKRKASEDPSITDDDATATPATAQTGTKRKAEDQDLDASRADRGSAEAQDTSGTSKGKAKRKVKAKAAVATIPGKSNGECRGKGQSEGRGKGHCEGRWKGQSEGRWKGQSEGRWNGQRKGRSKCG